MERPNLYSNSSKSNTGYDSNLPPYPHQMAYPHQTQIVYPQQNLVTYSQMLKNAMYPQQNPLNYYPQQNSNPMPQSGQISMSIQVSQQSGGPLPPFSSFNVGFNSPVEQNVYPSPPPYYSNLNPSQQYSNPPYSATNFVSPNFVAPNQQYSNPNFVAPNQPMLNYAVSNENSVENGEENSDNDDEEGSEENSVDDEENPIDKEEKRKENQRKGAKKCRGRKKDLEKMTQELMLMQKDNIRDLKYENKWLEKYIVFLEKFRSTAWSHCPSNLQQSFMKKAYELHKMEMDLKRKRAEDKEAREQRREIFKAKNAAKPKRQKVAKRKN